jgi:hypothetical protein
MRANRWREHWVQVEADFGDRDSNALRECGGGNATLNGRSVTVGCHWDAMTAWMKRVMKTALTGNENIMQTKQEAFLKH